MNFAPRFLLAFCLFAAGCERETSGPILQRGYLWQRHWTTATTSAFEEADARLDGTILLGGEVLWDGRTPHFVRASIAWESVARARKPVGLALRVAPFREKFSGDDANARFLIETAKSLLADAARAHANVSEFQLDFDCAQKKLGAYRGWLHSLGQVVRPTKFSITVLPSWLDEPEFASLLGEVDGYVLQVHSVPIRDAELHPVLCDPQLAKKWVAQAARLGRPFSVALPTYRCLAGYDARGKLLGVAMDSIQPSWPNGTRVLEFGANADQLAQLVANWKHARSATLRDLIWYRVPNESDARNWRWPTLAAVMEGRAPRHQLEVVSAGENPIDISLVNKGEADEEFVDEINATWNDATLVASDAVSGATLRIEATRAVFAIAAENALQLSPGDRRAIGWLRYDRSVQPRISLAETSSATR